MKKAISYLGVVVFFFLPLSAYASNIYVQTIDNTGRQVYDAYLQPPTQDIGSFSLNASTTFGYLSTITFAYQTLKENSGSYPNDTLVGSVSIASNSSCFPTHNLFSFSFGYGGGSNLSNIVDGQWRTATLNTGYGTTTLGVGTYYLCAENDHGASGVNENVFQLAVSSYNSSLYGLITDNGTISLNTINGTPSTPSLPNNQTFIDSVQAGNLNTGYPLLDQYATSTASSTQVLNPTNFLSFLNVPALLTTRVPFAYIFQFAQVINSAISATSTAETPTLVFNISIPLGTSSTTISLDMFSSSTILHFIPQDDLNLLRGLLVAILYWEVGVMLYHDARDNKHLF